MTARGPAISNTHNEEFILSSGFLAIEKALAVIYDAIDDDTGFDSLWNPRLKKYALQVDLDAQKQSENLLKEQFDHQIEIRGEESSLAPLSDKEGLGVLLDMVDGTDLLERQLGNWCSAMIFFDTHSPRIWAAMIGLPNKEIFYARASYEGAYVRQPKKKKKDANPVHKISIKKKYVDGDVAKPIGLRDASLCFYGQKPKSFLKTVGNAKLLKKLQEFADEAIEKKDTPDAPKIRIYNFAGNPMMMTLLEGRIDAIIELSGQRCHDVAPGFVIALKAGAHLYNLDDKSKIDIDHIAKKILDPNTKFRYIMACNETIAHELLDLL